MCGIGRRQYAALTDGGPQAIHGHRVVEVPAACQLLCTCSWRGASERHNRRVAVSLRASPNRSIRVRPDALSFAITCHGDVAATSPTTNHTASRPLADSVGILSAALRGLALLVSGRVRFVRDDIGRTLTMEDGEEFTVFRHARVEGAAEPAGVFVVRFTPAHMSVRQNIRFSLLPVIPLLGQRGFREKYWCVNATNGMCQGVYAWQTVADADAYAHSVALRFMTGRSLPGSVSHQILDQSHEPYWAFRKEP